MRKFDPVKVDPVMELMEKEERMRIRGEIVKLIGSGIYPKEKIQELEAFAEENLPTPKPGR